MQDKATIETRNQVAAAYAEIEKTKEKMALQAQLQKMAEDNYAAAIEGYNNQLATLLTVKKAELSLVYAQRDSRKLQYDLELKYIHLKRILGANMMTNEIPKA